jgi:mRNA-degrading endonuclease toxin of MazEF toxin-antitoxin module
MIALDQIRTIDKRRLIRKVGSAKREVRERIKGVILEMLVQ